jgi:hypothetical protein
VSAVLPLWVHLRRDPIDRRLASGASPHTPALRLRAEELTSRPARTAMADAAEALRDAESEPGSVARGELTALAARLRSTAPITSAGAARAYRLLRTRGGDDECADLWERAWDITDALDDHAR